MVRSVFFALIAGLLPAFAGAEPVQTRQLAVGADYCAILRAFTDAPDTRCIGVAPDLGATRSTRAPGGFSPEAAPISAPGSPPGYFIRFGFNSVALTPEYRAHLDRLSEVFSSQTMQGVCIKLVGHTDVLGEPSYNMRLSMARARIVADYLRQATPVSGERLLSAGRGEAAPLPGVPGGHPLNRRVEILAKAKGDQGCK
ncbi:MAG: OmpA family protein [Pseudomonadota bacterium]